MEINVAVDELLGIRGPLGTLVRNLLWLLAFNATYLGIFAFVPKAVGSAAYSSLLNTTICDNLLKTIPYVQSEDEKVMTVLKIISSVNDESAKRDTTFRLPDIVTVTLGYFSIAAMIVVMRSSWTFLQKFRQPLNTEEEQEQGVANDAERLGIAAARVRQMDDIDEIEEAGIEVALDATVVVVKVGILLFLKMFLLPLMLGLWLDASTMPLLGHEVSRRIAFAGGDIFSFILLHWVAGITFMLLITVFLLQLREVAHPDLLARLIRPQEPQPDLLGNLMHETVSTHMKRMFLSLGIYAPLLTLHVYVPVYLFCATGLGDNFTFFHLKFWHIVMPQMQIPIELIIFHLSMLALLERYKNSIGGWQYRWTLFMCNKLGLTDHILPREVDHFILVGMKDIFVDDPESNKNKSSKLDEFWYELVTKERDFDFFIDTNVEKTETTALPKVGTSKVNGMRVLDSSTNHIRLPSKSIGDDNDQDYLLRTKIGRFCLCKNYEGDKIEFWREVPGKNIPRPPEGWDDLGAGGAFVQGRWAWGKERKSTIEEAVAKRTPFRISESQSRPVGLLLKVAGLFFLSWVAITFSVVGLVSVPLAFGRSFYYLFRVPETYIHDPFAFCLGVCIFFPLMSILLKNAKNSDDNPSKSFKDWLSRFRMPPKQKLLIFLESVILWTLVAPMSLGVTYEIVAVKTAKWFGKDEPLVDAKSILLSWLVGTVVLNIWALLACNGIFTRAFWANIGNGILQPVEGNAARVNNVNGDPANPDQAAGNDGLDTGWQGMTGRVASFFIIWRSVLLKWEWDTVNRVVLLDEFARPITRQVASTLVGSSLSWQFILYFAPLVFQVQKGAFIVPFLGEVERSLFRIMLFRICTVLHVTVQICSAFRGYIESWFQVAHAAARDDRYLIAEILRNYDPEDEHFE
jgi:E3 ubiquitin-protein ligase MARCH6